MEEFLTRTLTDDGSLTTPGTPQNDAYESLITNFPNLAVGVNDAEITQTYSLNTLFYSTNGTLWRMRDSWTGPDPVCGDVGVTDAWFGITCNAEGSIISLDLRENDLFGVLPSEIRALVSLGKYDHPIVPIYDIAILTCSLAFQRHSTFPGIMSWENFLK